MSADAAPATAASSVQHEGWSLSGSTPAEDVRESLRALDKPKGGAEADESEIAKAASELGKKGGKAAAAKRAKEAKAAKPVEGEPEGEGADPERKPAATAKPATEEAATTDDDEGEEHRSRARERVEEATRQRAEERRRADRAEREAAELRERVARLGGRQEGRGGAEPERREARPAATGDDEAPQLDKFLAEHDDYNAGLAAYLEARDKHRDAQREKAERGRQRAESIGSRVHTFREKVAAEGPEFMESLSEDVRTLKPSFALDRERGERATGRTFIADALVLHPEHATGLMRHFTAEPRDFQRIAALGSPYLVSFEVGKIVARLEGATSGTPSSDEQPAPKPASKAPAPVRPVTGAPSAAPGSYGPRPGEHFDQWYLRTGGKTASR